MSQLQLVGIDVSQKTLAVAIAPEAGPSRGRAFNNDPTGHRNLVRCLTQQGRTARIALEATGVYHLDLALALHRAPRLQIMVVNPKAASHFAKACLQRSKTDPEDAMVLLEFVRRMDFVPWQPPSSEQLDLRAHSRRMAILVKMRAQEKNRLHAASASDQLPAAIRNDIQVHLRYLQRRIQQIQNQALKLIEADPELRRRLHRLVSVKGIAVTTGIQILAEIALLPEAMGARQWVAHAGLDPRQTVSGSSVAKPPRISKAGNVHLRRALFMPALVAMRYEPAVKAYYNRLIDRGKKPLQALVAVMRKLLHAIYGMLRHDLPFDGEKFCPTWAQTA